MMRGRHLLPVIAALAACSGGGTTCGGDLDCPGPRRVLAPAGMWDIEVIPPAESAWARTEVVGLAFPGEAALVKLEPKVEVGGVIDPGQQPPGTSTLSMAGLSLSVPSAMPGHAALRFDVQGVSPSPRMPIEFQVGLPASTMGRSAELHVVPSPGLARTVPPWSARIAALDRATPIAVAVPETSSITVKLKNAINDDVTTGYTATALLNGRTVSNLAAFNPMAQGLVVTIPKSLAMEALTLEIAPADPQSLLPVLHVPKPPTIPGTIVTVRLPSQPTLQPYLVPVSGGGAPIAGTVVRLQTDLSAEAVGAQATFSVEGQTDMAGLASVRLRPGAPGDTRRYVVAAIPPADSPFASLCDSFSVVMSDGDVRVGASIELPPRAELTGRITNPDGAPMPGVSITATRRKDDPGIRSCAIPLASPPTGTTSRADGSYRLLVDPGRYRIEYEPSSRLAAALLVEPDVVTSGAAHRDVTLPAGAPAEGIVQAPGGIPVPGCEVRAYAPGVGGVVRARGRTGSDGRFRLVLPRR
jgi:hypothetical protein